MRNQISKSRVAFYMALIHGGLVVFRLGGKSRFQNIFNTVGVHVDVF